MKEAVILARAGLERLSLSAQTRCAVIAAGLLVLLAHSQLALAGNSHTAWWLVAMLAACGLASGWPAQRARRQLATDRQGILAEAPDSGLDKGLTLNAVMRRVVASAQQQQSPPQAFAWQPTTSHVRALDPFDDMACAIEHNRHARDLHDSVSQTLFAANLLAGALARSPDASTTARAQGEVLQRLNGSALSEMRMMLYELQPDTLHGVRMPELLSHAVGALVGRGSIEISTDIQDRLPLPTAQRVEVYRIARAALSNIGRHSGANKVHLRWQTSPGESSVLQITDNGCGFDAAAECHAGTGVSTIRDRARALTAALVIQSSPGQGTDITLTLEPKEAFA